VVVVVEVVVAVGQRALRCQDLVCVLGVIWGLFWSVDSDVF